MVSSSARVRTLPNHRPAAPLELLRPLDWPRVPKSAIRTHFYRHTNRSKARGCGGDLAFLWQASGELLKSSILRSLVSLWYLYGIFMVSEFTHDLLRKLWTTFGRPAGEADGWALVAISRANIRASTHLRQFHRKFETNHW